jgi:hypothetical protein
MCRCAIPCQSDIFIIEGMSLRDTSHPYKYPNGRGPLPLSNIEIGTTGSRSGKSDTMERGEDPQERYFDLYR